MTGQHEHIYTGDNVSPYVLALSHALAYSAMYKAYVALPYRFITVRNISLLGEADEQALRLGKRVLLTLTS